MNFFGIFSSKVNFRSLKHFEKGVELRVFYSNSLISSYLKKRVCSSLANPLLWKWIQL